MIVEKQPDTILHLGAGRCSEFREWDASGARRIILVEADPENARYLRATYGDDERVEVVERAVSGTGGPATLRRLNIARFSSIREPSGLRELYPSLRTRGEIPLAALSPSDLCEQIGVQEITWLMVDVPGEEWETLREFHDHGFLEDCDWLAVSVGSVPLFEGSAAMDQVSAELRERGYELTSRDGGADPDRPRLAFRRDVTRIKNRELETRIGELTEELNKERDLRISVAAQLDVRNRELVALKKEADELASKVSSLNSNVEALRKAKNELQAASSRGDEQLSKLKERYEQERTARETAAKQGEVLTQQIESLTSERDELAGRVSELTSQIEERTTEIKKRDEDARRIQSDAETVREQQGKLNHEILRAEAQIDLIKDVLLSDKSL